MEDINMKLVDSIQALDLEDVLTCLNSGADCNFKYKKSTPRELSILFIAIHNYLVFNDESEYKITKDILFALLDKKPDLSVVDKNGNTVLHKLLSQNISAYFDYVQDDKLHIVDTLIKLGAPVDVPNEKGEFSIHIIKK